MRKLPPIACALVLVLAAPDANLRAQVERTRSAPRAGEFGLQLAQPTPVARVDFPRQNIVGTDLRWVDAHGVVRRTGMDGHGVPIEFDAVRATERELGDAARQKFAPSLHAAFESAGTGATLGVALWLARDVNAPDTGRFVRAAVRGLAREQVGDALRAARRAALEIEAAHNGPRQAVVADAARALGATLLEIPAEWPFVLVRADASAARSLAARADVEVAYLLADSWEEEGEFAQGTLRSHPLFDLGVEADASVRMLVNDTAQVQVNNVYLPPIVALNASASASHATGVAGNIANRHPSHRALAAGLPVLYSAGGSGDAAAPGIWSNAIAQGIDMGNCSWWNFQSGSIQFLDRFFDHTIRTYSVMLFKSNGNQGGGSQPFATTPGNGYNMVSTGAYSDDNTVGWDNDTITDSSSWWNPIEGHEKPEVASPGTCVTSTGTGGDGLQSCFGGTSSASPLVAGLGALLASVDNTLLAQMTTLKAVLMASAWHNVEGAPLLSDRDGAGSVHAMAAYQLVKNGQWWHDEVTDADFAADVLDVTFDAVVGQSVRVVALWQSQANGTYTSDLLEMDLDLVVLDPSGTPLASSASPFNAFEIAGFDAPSSGTYTVRLTRQRFDGISEPLSVVWSFANDTGHAQIVYAPGSPAIKVGSRPIFRFRDRYTGAGKPYQAIASTALTPDGTPPIGSGFILPVGYDGFASYSAGLPGFGGTFGALGSTRASLLIPPDPTLAGLGLHLALVVFEPGGAVATVAPPLSFTIDP